MYKVLLVDDENLLLDSLEIILSLNGMEIVGKANDGKEALDILEGTECDIALVDINMKGMGGIELIGHMKEKHKQVKILVLTTFYDDDNITKAITGGADGYLLKDSGKDTILGAINQIMGGVTVLDQKVMLRLTQLMSQAGTGVKTSMEAETENTNEGDKSPNLSNLARDITQREQEICTLMVEGLTNKQIAQKLYISEGTVKNYISNIYDKTGIHDRVKLIVALKEA
ncbi:MAG: response regulator transcription factor [Lachnospiraceae bacterium]|nr:response regulator transcription factor [Lachnospiraceae bacterium]